jgi:hypothetical protein
LMPARIFERFRGSRVDKGHLDIRTTGENRMCDKCAELDAKIEHYQKKMAQAITDRLALEAIADRIKKMEAQKVKLHPEQGN